MTTVRDLVDSLIDGKTIDIQYNLSDIMSDKLSNVLDVYKMEVARNMFNPQADAEESEELEDSEETEVEVEE